MEKYVFPEGELSFIENMRVPFAVYQLIDKRVVTLALSKGFCELFGYDEFEPAYYDMDNNMYKDTHPDDAGRIASIGFHFAAEGGKYDVIYRSLDKDKTGYNIIHAKGEHIYTEKGIQLAQVWYTCEGEYTGAEEMETDSVITFMNKALYESTLLTSSYYDYLTGLPSMTYFFELAEERKGLLSPDGKRPAVLFTDFTGMKYFNHKYGFSGGDKLLKAFARLLADVFGNENCCRMGQDHFVVIAPSDGIEPVLNLLFERCKTINDGCSLPVHVGIYKHWFDGIAPSVACDRAKFACDTMRGIYTSKFSYYNLSMKDAEEKQHYITANIDKAIAEGWIKVYYQPIVRAINGRVCDEEALARWDDPVMGFMSPADFIPILEDHRLIYKLDLYVVESVLKKIKIFADAGLSLVSQSINLSRSDFDTCDIVEEIRRRVDAAGIPHSLITIEITESIIAKDFEFMKVQIQRFRDQGFAVWMDDFGSGYSSLDVLQSIKFDLIKFDMRFMQKFNENCEGRIILTEMLRMATSLGLDTICEGVETEEQILFLKETGCSKLQGYAFDRPNPVEKILEKYDQGRQIGFEDPNESDYYDRIGRINLHDLSIIAQDDPNDFASCFNTLPIAVIELNGSLVRFARSNQSYRDFMDRYFTLKVTDTPEPFHDNIEGENSPFMQTLIRSADEYNNFFVDERLPGDTSVHSCMRRIAVNPVNGTKAVVVAVLSVNDKDNGADYAGIARALAADYLNLYYVDLRTDSYVEYSSKAGTEDITIEKHGEDFFAQSLKDAQDVIYTGDLERFAAVFTKENIISELDRNGSFRFSYHLLKDGTHTPVTMKAMRMQQDPNHIIIGVSNAAGQARELCL